MGLFYIQQHCRWTIPHHLELRDELIEWKARSADIANANMEFAVEGASTMQDSVLPKMKKIEEDIVSLTRELKARRASKSRRASLARSP